MWLDIDLIKHFMKINSGLYNMRQQNLLIKRIIHVIYMKAKCTLPVYIVHLNTYRTGDVM